MSSDSVNEFLNELKALTLQRTRRSQELHSQFETLLSLTSANNDDQLWQQQQFPSVSSVSKVKQFSELMRKAREEDKLRTEKENWILHSLKAIQQFTQASKRGVYSASVEIMKSMHPLFEGHLQLEELSSNTAEFRQQFGQLFQCFFQPFEKAYEFKSTIKILLKPTNDLLKYLIEFSRDNFTSFLAFWREHIKLSAKTQPAPKIPLLSPKAASVDQQCRTERDECSSISTTPSTGTTAVISTASTIEEKQSPKKHTRSLSPTKAAVISTAPKRVVSPLKKIASEAFLQVKEPEAEPKRVSETIRFVSPAAHCQQWVTTVKRTLPFPRQRFNDKYESNRVFGGENLNAMPFDSSVLCEVMPELDQVHINVQTFKIKKLKEPLDKQQGITYNEELNILRSLFDASYERNAYISNSIQVYLSQLHDSYNNSLNFPSLLGEILSASYKTTSENNSSVAHRLVLRMQKFRILFAKRYAKSKADLANVTMNWSNSVITGAGGLSVSQSQASINDAYQQQKQSPLRNRFTKSNQTKVFSDTTRGISPSDQSDSKRYNIVQTAEDSDDSPSKYYCNNSMSSYSKVSCQQITKYQEKPNEYLNEGELRQVEELLPWNTTEGQHNEEFEDLSGQIDEQINNSLQQHQPQQQQRITCNLTQSQEVEEDTKHINNGNSPISQVFSAKTIQQNWQMTNNCQAESKSIIKQTSFHQKHHSLISRPSSSKDFSNIPGFKVSHSSLADVSKQQLSYLSEMSSHSPQLKANSSQLNLVAINSPREVQDEQALSFKQPQHQPDITQLQSSKQYAIKQQQSSQQKNIKEKMQHQHHPSLILLHAKREKLLGSRSIAAFKTIDNSYQQLGIKDTTFKGKLQIQGTQAFETQPRLGISNVSTVKISQASKLPSQISNHRKDIQILKETIDQKYSAQFSSFQDIFDDSQILNSFNNGCNKPQSESIANFLAANSLPSQNSQGELSQNCPSVSGLQSPTQPSKASCCNPCELPTKITRMYDKSCGSAFLKPLEESLGEISPKKVQQSQNDQKNQNKKASVMKGRHSKSTAVLAGFSDLLSQNRCSSDEETFKNYLISSIRDNKQRNQDKSTLFLYPKAALEANCQHNDRSFNSSCRQVIQTQQVLKVDSPLVPVSSRTDSTKSRSNMQGQINQNLRNDDSQNKLNHLNQQKTNQNQNQTDKNTNNQSSNQLNFNGTNTKVDNLKNSCTGGMTPTSANSLDAERRQQYLNQSNFGASLEQHRQLPKQQVVIQQPMNQRYFFNDHCNSLSSSKLKVRMDSEATDGFVGHSNTLMQSFHNVSNTLLADLQQTDGDSPLKAKTRLIRVSRNGSQGSLISQRNHQHKQSSSYSLLLSSSCNVQELTASTTKGNNTVNQIKQVAGKESKTQMNQTNCPENESDDKTIHPRNLHGDTNRQVETMNLREGGTQKQSQKKEQSIINGKLLLASHQKRIPSNEDYHQLEQNHQMQQGFPVRVLSTNLAVQPRQSGQLESNKVVTKKTIASSSSSVTFKKPIIPKQPGWNGLYRNYQPLLQ